MLWGIRSGLGFYQVAAVVAAVGVQFVARQVSYAAVPEAVAAAVAERFPGASWRAVEKEDRGSRAVHEVTVRHGGTLFEVTVTPVVEVKRRGPASRGRSRLGRHSAGDKLGAHPPLTGGLSRRGNVTPVA